MLHCALQELIDRIKWLDYFAKLFAILGLVTNRDKLVHSIKWLSGLVYGLVIGNNLSLTIWYSWERLGTPVSKLIAC